MDLHGTLTKFRGGVARNSVWNGRIRKFQWLIDSFDDRWRHVTNPGLSFCKEENHLTWRSTRLTCRRVTFIKIKVMRITTKDFLWDYGTVNWDPIGSYEFKKRKMSVNRNPLRSSGVITLFPLTWEVTIILVILISCLIIRWMDRNTLDDFRLRHIW